MSSYLWYIGSVAMSDLDHPRSKALKVTTTLKREDLLVGKFPTSKHFTTSLRHIRKGRLQIHINRGIQP